MPAGRCKPAKGALWRFCETSCRFWPVERWPKERAVLIGGPQTSRPAIDITAVPDFYHEHQQSLVFDGVENPVVANPDAKNRSVFTLQRLRAGWAWIHREAVDRVDDPAKRRLIFDFLEVALGGGLELDAVRRLCHG